MLDQPLSGHDETESEPVLRAALARHRQELAHVSPAQTVPPDGQYWSVLARALQEIGRGARDQETIAILREGISYLPCEVDLYLQLGGLLERSDVGAAIELYSSFPAGPEGEPGFNQAVCANAAVRLILEQREWGSPHLLDQLVTVGKVSAPPSRLACCTRLLTTAC